MAKFMKVTDLEEVIYFRTIIFLVKVSIVQLININLHIIQEGKVLKDFFSEINIWKYTYNIFLCKLIVFIYKHYIFSIFFHINTIF